jgi:hypothetical protein
METLFYILIVLSGLLGLAAGGLALFLGWMLCSSYGNSDQIWGWVIIVCGLLYAAHPVLAHWLFKNSHEQLGMGLTVLFIVLSIALIFFLVSAIEVGARP